MTIKQNETIGRLIEALVAKDIPGAELPFIHRGPYDIETSTQIIEVKSCKLRNKGIKKNRRKQATQQGRFFFSVVAHSKLQAIAKDAKKEAFYMLVLYDIGELLEIIDRKLLPWKQVDKKLQSRKPYKRNDGAKLTCIALSMFFKQKRLQN